MFDISLNLTDSSFFKDRDAVIIRAINAKINGVLIIGTTLYESSQAQQLAIQYGYWSTAGVHPHNSGEWTTKSAEEIYILAQNKRVIAIGECGLDFDRKIFTLETQEKAFTMQLALAAELEKPVFLHCRNASERLLALLDPWLDKLPGIVLHCFTGSYQEALEYLNRGIYLGITGWVCDERRGLEVRELLPFIPIKQILLETDAPYLLPRDMRPKPKSNRNEPSYLAHILQRIALWRKEDPEKLEEQTDENVRRLFKISF